MRVKISDYKKSIYEINLPEAVESVIWDFYVTRSFAASASQKRSVKDFDIKQIPLKEMISIAGIESDNFKIKACTTMPNTIKALDLITIKKVRGEDKKECDIEIDTPRLCCLQPFTVNEDNEIKPKISQADCIFTHIRNAFAHGNTYFFDNGNMLLEDKDSNKVTARILIKVETLIEWIKIIDSKKIVYPELH